jgi:hypothetical protein
MNDEHLAFVEISWVQQVLARILGGSPRSVTPDAIGELLGPIEWKPAEGWDTLDDSTVATTAGLFDAGFSGHLLIVTDVSFVSGKGAFSIASEELSLFVSEYSSRCEESFFDGDVVVVEELGERVWVFHHEGVCATLNAG